MSETHDEAREEHRRVAARYLDDEERLTTWPSKRTRKLAVLEWLAEAFEWDVRYTEREVNELLDRRHTFGDRALLRRELFEHGFLDRTRDGAGYWRRRPDPSSTGGGAGGC